MIYRKFEDERSGNTYYVPVDQVNANDDVLCDIHDPNSRGYGGSTFNLETTDETIDDVKGPWHTSVPYDVCKATDLKFTKVTIIEDPKSIPYTEWNTIEEKYGKNSVEYFLRVTGTLLYRETEWVLGPFMRGARIAQQLADLRNKDIFFHQESQGGAYSTVAKPGGKLHPMAERAEIKRERHLSAEQQTVVES